MGQSDSTKVTAYNGNEPYIFVSYSHKDAKTVISAISAIQGLGYRVWLDLGIEVGTEWSNNIASHLRDCAAFIAFVSSNSVNSENCLDEIAYAKSHKKPSLMIFLEENVTLPEGTDMQTARFQRMFFNRQDSIETFTNNINNAPILAMCRGEAESATAETVVPPQKISDEKKTEKGSAKSVKIDKKTAMIGGGAILAVILILVLVMALSGGKQDPVTNTNSDIQTSGETSQSEQTPEEVSVEMSDNLLDYTFKLEGEVYQIPFAFTDLTDKGWTITSSGYSSDTLVGGLSKESLIMVKDGKRISIGVYNQSGNALTIAECSIGEISVEVDDNVDFEIAKGIVPGTSADDVVAAFGTPGSRDSYDDYVRLTYGGTDYGNDGVTFYCYTAEDQAKYSSIRMKHYVITESSTTDTDDTVPEYLSEYVAPTEFGDNALSGVVKIEGDLYQIPTPVQQFIDNGWTVSDGPGAVVAGGSDSIGLSRDDVKITVTVANGAEYQTTPQNCVVTGVAVYDSDAVDIELPGGAKLGLTDDEVKSCLPDTMEINEGTYNKTYSYYEYTPRNFSLYISVNVESGTVKYIKLDNRSWGVSAE